MSGTGTNLQALLDAAAAIATQNHTRVLRASGVEFEADVSHSTLNQLLLPLEWTFEELGEAHRTAMGVALGLGQGQPPARLPLSSAALALLRRESARGPMLVIVDDLPWIDRASARVLGSVARRLNGTRIGFLAAARTGVEGYYEREGLPEQEQRPLDDEAAGGLIDGEFPLLAAAVRQRLLSEAQGNPLALVELPAALSEPERSALQALPPLLPLSRRLLNVFASRVAELPPSTRRLMLLAALDGSGDLCVLEAHGAGHDRLEQLHAAEAAHLAYVDAHTSAGIPPPSHPHRRRRAVDQPRTAPSPQHTVGAVVRPARPARMASRGSHRRARRTCGRIA